MRYFSVYPARFHSHILTVAVIGKAEGQSTEWHGHITALTVAPEYRRLYLARNMINILEMVSDQIYKGFFVDLYVRCANRVAIEMYEGLGYSVYRRVKEYYGSLGLGKGGRDEEDAFGKSLSTKALSAGSDFSLFRYAETTVKGSRATISPSKWARYHRQSQRCIVTWIFCIHSKTACYCAAFF